MKTILEQMEDIQKLTDDLVVQASKIHTTSSSIVEGIVRAGEVIIEDQIKDGQEEDNKE